MFGKVIKKTKIKLFGDNQRENTKTIALSKKQIKDKEEYLKILMNKTNPPMVILDNGWYKVKELVGNAHIEQKETYLKALIKEQASLTKEIKQDTLLKQNFMQDVLKISDQINSEGYTQGELELEKLHQGIIKLGERLEVSERRLMQLEEEMKGVNLELIEEAVAIGYEYMEICKTHSALLSKDIDVLREEVLKKTSDKKVYDEHANILYQYLHNMIGYKHIDKVDQVLGE